MVLSFCCVKKTHSVFWIPKTSKHVKQVERRGCKKILTWGATCCLTICSEFSLFYSPAVLFDLLAAPTILQNWGTRVLTCYFILFWFFYLTPIAVIYLLENSRGLECSRLLWQEHFLEAGASQGPLQGVFLLHIPHVLLQPPQGDCCLQRHEKIMGEVFFFNISLQTTALNDTLFQFTISRLTQTMASISFASQANISPDAPG